MKSYVDMMKSMQVDSNNKTLQTIIDALMNCSHCDRECPFYKEYMEERDWLGVSDPLWYCQSVMAYRLARVRATLEG